MAALVNAITTQATANGTSYTSGAFTPAASDYLLVFVHASDTTVDGTLTDSQSLGWTKLSGIVSNTNNRFVVFKSNTTAAASSMTVTWDCTGDAATGALLAVMRVSASDGNIRQITNNAGAAASTPSVVFSSSCLTSSAVVFATANLSNPHGNTVPSGFTARNGAAYNTPTTGVATSASNSGFTSNTITAGGLSGTDWTVIGIEVYNAGVTTQTLTPVLFTNSATFFASVLSAGAVTLTPALHTNANTFYAAEVTQSSGTTTLTPSLFTNTNTFYGSTIEPGSVSITPALFTNTNTFYGSTIEPGSVSITPALFTNTNTFYGSSLGLSIATSLFTNTNTFYDSTVTAGGVDIEPSLFTNSSTFYASTVTPGEVPLSAGLFTNSNTFYQYNLTSELHISPSFFINTNTFYNADISDGLGGAILSDIGISVSYKPQGIDVDLAQPVIESSYKTQTIKVRI